MNVDTLIKLTEFFVRKIDVRPTTGCWNWTAFTDRDGYGLFSMRCIGTKRANRMSLYLFKGIKLGKYYALHKCDNRRCVNPDHIYSGTALDNINDMIKRNRFVKTPKGVERMLAISCRNDHLMQGDNVRYKKDGYRICVTCEKINYERKKQRYHALKARKFLQYIKTLQQS